MGNDCDSRNTWAPDKKTVALLTVVWSESAANNVFVNTKLTKRIIVFILFSGTIMQRFGSKKIVPLFLLTELFLLNLYLVKSIE